MSLKKKLHGDAAELKGASLERVWTYKIDGFQNERGERDYIIKLQGL